MYIIVALLITGWSFGDALETSTEYSGPPKPYSFRYEAGRYPGQVDRIHQETADGSGTVHGSYAFVDPKQKVRIVEYTADKTGFHPSLTNYEDTFRLPVDSEAVRQAKEKHFDLYEKIANRNADGAPSTLPADTSSVLRATNQHYQLYRKIAEEHAAISAQREAERLAYEATSEPNDVSHQQNY
ncbi:uncharacterized protein LOC105702154 [Orussus abietinus]|uniref:uncharacterized protein LOC105702154 n=1 Tax=Orussus abietinus TaxID=222816 RepID=UPI000625F06D|nr:uncharacterized protein LOC105702154 [Orussus abietinus]